MSLKLLIAIGCSVTVFAIPRPDTKDQLKRLAHLPRIEFGSPLSFSVEAGFVAFPDSAAVQEKLSRLRKENKKDSSQGMLFLKMARLQERVNNRGEALALYYRASELLRKKIEIEPEDFAGFCALGETLTGLGKFPEAEHYIEKALTLDSRKAAGWAALGNLEKMRAYRALAGDDVLYNNSAFHDNLSDLVRDKSDIQQIEQAEKYLKRAAANFNKAVELEPAESDWLVRRAAFKAFRAAMERAILLLRGRETSTRDFTQSIYNDAALQDLLAAAQTEPDAENIAACAMFPLV